MEHDIVVCGPKSVYPDDLKDHCYQCKEVVYCRPHAPSNAKRMCLECFTILLHDANRQDTFDFHISQKQRQEYAEYKKSQVN